MTHWMWFARRWKGHGLYGLFLVVMTMLSTAVFLCFPLFFRHMIDALRGQLATADAAAGLALRDRLLMILGGLGILRFAVSFYPALRARMNHVVERELRTELFDALLEKDHAFFTRFRTGDVVTRLTDDVAGYPKISWFTCSGFFRAFNSACIVVACVGAMLWIRWELALATLVPLPLALATYVWISRRLRTEHDKRRALVSRTTNHLESCFAGVRILKAYNAEGREAERFRGLLRERFDQELLVVSLVARLHTFFRMVSHFAQILVVALGGWMVIEGRLTMGDFYAFFAYLGLIVYPMLDVPNLLVTSREAFSCVDRVEEIRRFGRPEEAPSPHAAEAKGIRLEGPVETVTFEGVTFGYGDERPVLRDLTFGLCRGERLAIVGRIGSGKSTLLNLVAGILTPREGRILVNGHSVSELDPGDWRGRIGYIGQDPIVFSETVAENIRFWRGYDQPDLERAARSAQIADEIEAFPEGYGQRLGQRGVNVSGGQKQRLTIARAIVGKPEVLIMDDVTASLDSDSEEQFWADLDEASRRITVLIVTHRLATVRRADRILVLDDGAVAAEGSFSHLRAESELFRRVLQLEV